MPSPWLALEEALQQALDATSAVNTTQTVSIFEGLGRITSSDVVATIPVPPWDNSAMDGYAFNADDLNTTKTLPIQGTLTAGMSADEALKPGYAFKIMTGAPVPEGADTVEMIENTDGGDDQVTFLSSPKAGANIRVKENDIAVGQVLVPANTRLQPEHLMLLSSQGMCEVQVFRKVKVGIVATGDELATPGEQKLASQIYESNRIGVASLIAKLGVEVVDFGIVKDNKQALADLFSRAQQDVDIMISSGGVSVGEADFVKDILENLGKIDFWKIAIKPGKPFALGKIGNTVFCGLPGNPVSSFVTTQLLVLPVIRKKQGESQHAGPLTVNATLTRDVKRRAGRRDFQRAIISRSDTGELLVTPHKNQSSGVMTSITQSNSFMVLHESVASINQGEQVPVIPFNLTL